MKLENLTALECKAIAGALSEEEMIVTLAAKATCRLEDGKLWLVPEDDAWPVFEGPTPIAGHTFAPEVHYGRRYVDIHVLGTAHSPGSRPVKESRVTVTSGEVSYEIDVIGDRIWEPSLEGLVPSVPEFFTEMPLSNDRAFGGKTEMDELEVPHAKNAAGRGYYADEDLARNSPLPNLERPDQRIRKWDDDPEPACLLRALDSALGIEQRLVMEDKVPVAPTSKLFQNAVPDLIVELGELGESIRLEGFCPRGPIEYPLPTERDLPVVNVHCGELAGSYPLPLSTVVIVNDSRSMVLTFQTTFRYWLVPTVGMASGELSWQPQDAFGSSSVAEQEKESSEERGRSPAQPKDSPSQAEPDVAPLPQPGELEQPELAEETPSHVFVAQPTGTPTLHVAIQRTYSYDEEGRLSLADGQLPLSEEVEFYEDVEEGQIASVKSQTQMLFKSGTDVVLQGSAQTYGEPRRELDVALKVGTAVHHGRVFGKRVCERTNGQIRFTAPELFEMMPLRYENAYGGRDAANEKAFVDESPPGELEKMKPFLLGDTERLSPFLYARNAGGKGFVCGSSDMVEGRELPNIEHPQDLLTPDRLVCPHFMKWVHQPVPFGFDFVDPQSFTQIAMLGLCPLHAPLEGPYPEVRLGLIKEDFVTKHLADLPPSKYETSVHRDASRAASLGLRFDYLQGSEPLELHNIDPARPLVAIRLPGETPELRVVVRGKEYEMQVGLYQVLIRAEERCLALQWTGSVPLKRKLVPRELAAVEPRVRWDESQSWKPA